MALQRKLNHIRASMENLKDQETHVRMDISGIVEAAGGEVKIDGFATYRILPDSERISYDRRALDDLADKFIQHNYQWVADKIYVCRKVTPYTGGLRIYPDHQR
jgi:hypothetical protein